ncbi:MAG TPA: J domain-containing protein, partial [Pyrinomonadaceae bacterium]
LGLKPDASEQELKNAYRDLAKVWHPDRFAHDPRLQQKAQEKLKEINEAYEAINSPASGRRHARRPTPPPPSSSTSTSAPRPPRGGPADFTPADFTTVVARRSDAGAGASRLTPVALAVAAVVITFFVSYRFLNSNTAAPAGVSSAAEAELSEEQRSEVVSDAGERVERKPAGKQPRVGEGAGTAAGGEGDSDAGARQSAPTYKTLPTVNRTIDPATGLLATRACPLKAIRTFASGEEPQKFCDADHTRR